MVGAGLCVLPWQGWWSFWVPTCHACYPYHPVSHPVTNPKNMPRLSVEQIKKKKKTCIACKCNMDVFLYRLQTREKGTFTRLKSGEITAGRDKMSKAGGKKQRAKRKKRAIKAVKTRQGGRRNTLLSSSTPVGGGVGARKFVEAADLKISCS